MKKILSFITLAFLLAVYAYSQNGLPQFDINKRLFDFGEVKLFSTGYDTVVFKNNGDTLLVIHSIDHATAPFFANFLAPDTLFPGEQVSYPVRYKPFKSGIDSQRIYINTDTRLSNSIALLIDISSSMDYFMPGERVKKINATISAVKKFINAMVKTPTIWDETGIFSFARNFHVNQDFTTDKVKLINSMPSYLYNYTALFDGCIETINRLKTRPFNRVMIVLSDGDDNISKYSADEVINRAVASKIRIYSVSIGGNTIDDKVLRRMATNTGGLFFEANTQKDLEDIYYEIFHLLSKNIQLSFDLKGNCPINDLIMNCQPDSGNHHPGDTVVYTFNLKNVNVDSAMNHKYKLKLKYNKTLMIPIDEDFEFLGNGCLSINGIVKNNLDSTFLKKIKFLTLVGDENCTDIFFDKLILDDSYYYDISSGDVCGLCVKLCARDLRQITLIKQNELTQNFPNPASDITTIPFTVSTDGRNQIILMDAEGSQIMELINKNLETGDYEISLNTSSLPSGLYFYKLISDSGIIIKALVISK